MNYYPFHIGDYAAHTSHLTWEEDIAYRRMLDWYYLNEKALPGDAAKVARLIRMPKSREAIETVLAEFFVLSEDGFHNKRADAELTGMLAKQEQQSSKDAHEADRMKRYRERRAQMFEALRKLGIVPAWDVPMKELQRLFDANCNGPATDLQREQDVSGNANATAIPTPTPTPTPTPKKDIVVSPAAPPQGTRLDKGWTLPDDWKAWCTEHRPDLDPQSVADQFRDFWVAKPGKDGRKADWLATWRNWCRSQKPGLGRGVSRLPDRMTENAL